MLAAGDPSQAKLIYTAPLEYLFTQIKVAAFGAAFISMLPTILKFGLPAMGIPLAGATAEHLTFLTVGTLIIVFLIAEPHGLARLWQIGKQKLRLWPFPY